MSADLLRRAAKVLRERAEAATAGPWEAAHDDLWSVVSSTSPAIEWQHQREVMTVHTPDGMWPDCAYVALMHPPVALALAELLETLAAEPGASNQFDLISAESLARAILREPEAVEPS